MSRLAGRLEATFVAGTHDEAVKRAQELADRFYGPDADIEIDVAATLQSVKTIDGKDVREWFEVDVTAWLREPEGDEL